MKNAGVVTVKIRAYSVVSGIKFKFSLCSLCPFFIIFCTCKIFEGIFHISKYKIRSPKSSTVLCFPVNFAYSLVAGLLNGNANVVRVPSKDFPQVSIIADAFDAALDKYEEMRPYIQLVRYGRDKDINDLFSSIADVRVVWGGNQTIEELRKSPLPPRSGEITFADRYSLAVIDSDSYLEIEDKDHVADDFYNDTFFSDQNACTSPRVVVWTGNRIEEAKKIFWEREHIWLRRSTHSSQFKV